MENFKYVVYYSLPKGGGNRRAIIEAPDSGAARNMADHMYGNVSTVVRDASRDSLRSDDASSASGINATVVNMGRDLARQQLGLLGDSLSDRAISILILLALAAPVVGLWMCYPIYKANMLAPGLGMPPLTICVGTGLVAFCLGWFVLYVCPVVLLRIIGFAVYAGWVIFYVSGWVLDLDLFRSVLLKIITVNSDAANLQKAELLIAGLAGFSVMGGLGKAVKGD